MVVTGGQGPGASQRANKGSKGPGLTEAGLDVVRHQDPGICHSGPSGNTVGLNDNKLYEIPDVPNPTPRKD